MIEDFVTKVVADIENLCFYLYSSDGDSKTVDCDSAEQFLTVLAVCKDQCTNNELTYAPAP